MGASAGYQAGRARARDRPFAVRTAISAHGSPRYGTGLQPVLYIRPPHGTVHQFHIEVTVAEVS